jgi:hypothetical protein
MRPFATAIRPDASASVYQVYQAAIARTLVALQRSGRAAELCAVAFEKSLRPAREEGLDYRDQISW